MNLNMFDTDGMVFYEREPMSYENKAYTGGMNAFPKNTPLAMAYVPFQQWGNTKSPEEALKNGTLFSDLVFPFMEVEK